MSPHGDDDRDLRDAFSKARTGERGRSPSFGALWEAARSRAGDRSSTSTRPRLRLAAAGAVLLILAAAGLAVRTRRLSLHGLHSRDSATLSITEWKAPTDFLLQTPGSAVLTTMPSIGRTSLSLPAHDAAPSSSHQE